MTSVKQVTAYTCALACIESLARDLNQPIGQCELIQRFPDLLCLGADRAGAVTPYSFCHILVSLGFADSFLVGQGKEFLVQNKAHLKTGVFVLTEKGDDGREAVSHCWRVENILDDGFVVVEPSPSIPNPFWKHEWSCLERRRCTIYVLQRAAKPKEQVRAA